MAATEPDQEEGSNRASPSSTSRPFEKALVAQRRRAEEKERQASRDRSRVGQRTQARIAQAERRHQQVLAGIAAEQEQDIAKLRAQSAALEGAARRCDEAAQVGARQAEGELQRLDATREQHAEVAQDGLKRVEQARNLASEHSAVMERRIEEVKEAGQLPVDASRDEASAQLAHLAHVRAELQGRTQQGLVMRGQNCETQVAAFSDEGQSAVLEALEIRRRTAMTVDNAGSQRQAAATRSQEVVKKNQEWADEQAQQLAQSTSDLEAQCAAALQAKQRASAQALEAAKDYCLEVQKELVQENSRYRRRMQDIETEAAFGAKAAERAVQSLEAERLQNFVQARQALQDVEDQLHECRSAHDGELGEVFERVRQVEADTSSRADQIQCEWLETGKATEQHISQLEEQGVEAVETMRKSIADKLQEYRTQNATAKETGLQAITALRLKLAEVMDSVQGQVAASSLADEQIAEAAHRQLALLRGQPRDLQRATDAAIDAEMSAASEEAQRLQEAAHEQIVASRSTTRAAWEEEQRLKSETAEAYSHLRRFCYELRLAGLHDFAEGIVAGLYDQSIVVKPGESLFVMPEAASMPGVLETY